MIYAMWQRLERVTEWSEAHPARWAAVCTVGLFAWLFAIRMAVTPAPPWVVVTTLPCVTGPLFGLAAYVRRNSLR